MLLSYYYIHYKTKEGVSRVRCWLNVYSYKRNLKRLQDSFRYVVVKHGVFYA